MTSKSKTEATSIQPLTPEDMEIEITPLAPNVNMVPRAVRVARYMAPKSVVVSTVVKKA